jgi:hypothetical protein
MMNHLSTEPGAGFIVIARPLWYCRVRAGGENRKAGRTSNDREEKRMIQAEMMQEVAGLRRSFTEVRDRL